MVDFKPELLSVMRPYAPTERSPAKPGAAILTVRRGFGVILRLLVGLGFCSLCSAADPPFASLPIPLRVDHQTLPSSVYLKFRYLPYNVTASKLPGPLEDRPAALFLKTVASVCDGDIKECSRLVAPGYDEGSAKLESVVGAFRRSFDLRTNELEVLGRADLGTNILFLWEADPIGEVVKSGSRARNFFSFARMGESDLFWDGARQDVLHSILRSGMQATLRYRDFAPLVTPRILPYEFAIPSTTNGVSVFLQFKGRFYGHPLLNGFAKTNDAVLSFIQEAYQTVERSDWASFGKRFTTESGTKFSKWITTKKPEEIAGFRQDTLDARSFVSFVMDADPIYIIFFASTLDPASLERHRHDYVWRDPVDGKLKLTNFYFQGFFDDFLNDPMNFEIPFLRPKLASIARTAKGSIPRPIAP